MGKTRLTTGLLIAATALPGAAQAQTPPYYTDLRSPDARDAAADPHYVNEVRHYTDLRSPDARDAALASEGNEPNRVPPVARVQTVSDGFDWGDSAIGATAMLGLLAAGGGAYLVLSSQRRRRPALPS